jgi:hypothetical protein
MVEETNRIALQESVADRNAEDSEDAVSLPVSADTVKSADQPRRHREVRIPRPAPR